MARDILVVVLRHGDKDAEGKLTELGKQQAKEAGEKLALNPNFLTKIYTSKSTRAIQTGQEIQNALKKVSSERYALRNRKELMGKIPDEAAFKDAIKKVGSEDAAVEAWLRNTFDPKAIEPVSAANKRIGLLLEFPHWMSKWLGEGTPVRLVYVSHSWTMAAMAELFLRKKLAAMGGPIRFCEPVVFKFPAKGKPSIAFRGKQLNISVKKLFPKPIRKPQPKKLKGKTKRRKR